MKSGTTSLFQHLSKHPNIYPPLTKGSKYFDKHYTKGIRWYKAHFPRARHKVFSKRLQNNNIITGESSPGYLPSLKAASRVLELVPKVKLIVLLRNPVDRAYSHYHYRLVRGRETSSFEDAVNKDLKNIAQDFESVRKQPQIYNSYLPRGIYVDQLKTWMRLFPREQILILESEQFHQQPQQTYDRVINFLGLPSLKLELIKEYNTGQYQEMAAQIRKKLITFFTPHNERLYDVLQNDLGWDR